MGGKMAFISLGQNMAVYKAWDPNVEVLGVSVIAFVDNMGDRVIPILKKFDLYPLKEDVWYNQQNVLNAYKKIQEHDFMNMVAIGMQIPDKAVWPPEIKTVHDALASIDEAYHINNRGGEIGHYRYTKTGERSGTMVCDNPYPSDFDYGIIYRVVQKFRGPDSDDLLVMLDESKPTRRDGADSCTYLIRW